MDIVLSLGQIYVINAIKRIATMAKNTQLAPAIGENTN